MAVVGSSKTSESPYPNWQRDTLEVRVSGGSNPLGDTMAFRKKHDNSLVEVKEEKPKLEPSDHIKFDNCPDYVIRPTGVLDPLISITPEGRKIALEYARKLLRGIEMSREEYDKLEPDVFIGKMLEVASFIVGDSHIEESSLIDFGVNLAES